MKQYLVTFPANSPKEVYAFYDSFMNGARVVVRGFHSWERLEDWPQTPRQDTRGFTVNSPNLMRAIASELSNYSIIVEEYKPVTVEPTDDEA